MTILSKQQDGKKIYGFELTEQEFFNAQNGQECVKHVEWSEGRGKWTLKFEKQSQ